MFEADACSTHRPLFWREWMGSSLGDGRVGTASADFIRNRRVILPQLSPAMMMGGIANNGLDLLDGRQAIM
jgi:hypothetical protein